MKTEFSITHHADSEGARFGMWLFLFTEILLFGGLFLLYSVYRSEHALNFHSASLELSRFFGTFNTVVLLTSSLTMALSIHFIRYGEQKKSMLFLILTILMGALFLINKYLEWSAKFEHGIYPGSHELVNRSRGEVLFYGLYFTMTGLHAFHVFAGILVLLVMLVLIKKQAITGDDYVKLENSGLYWHLVDIIWIFLFPLFYLIS